MKLPCLLLATLVVASCAGRTSFALNILTAGDPVVAVDTSTYQVSPANERVFRLLDNDPNTKYLSFSPTQSGFIVTPGTQAALQSFVITTANDHAERDPSSYEIYGTNSPVGSLPYSQGLKENWTLISSGALALPEERYTASAPVSFSNATSYSSYKVVFPTVKNDPAANSMQIADVAFYSGMDATGTSMLSSTDYIIPIRNIEPGATTSSSPGNGNEGPEKAVDQDPLTKYLNFGKEYSGLIVTPSYGPSKVTSFGIVTANDANDRDPTSFEIYGTNEPITAAMNGRGYEQNWTFVASGAINAPTARRTASDIVEFENNAGEFTSYLVIFPTIRNGTTANSMQVADIILEVDDPATLVINRQTGAVEIRTANQPVTLSGYEISSTTTGGLLAGNWTSIASTNADNEPWEESSAARTLLAEADLPSGTNNGFTIAANSSYSLGNIWEMLPSQFEDIKFTLFDIDGNRLSDTVEFVGTEIALGDYDRNGVINMGDWSIFRAGLGGQYSGLTRAEAYLGGDLDGDFDSDIFDFNLFVAQAGGYSALFGTSQVPEPSSVALIALGLVAGMGLRYRSRPIFRPLAILFACAVVLVSSREASAQFFTNVGGVPISVTTPDPNEGNPPNVNVGPDKWFDDDFLEVDLNGELFLLDYNDPDLIGTFAQWQGAGAGQKRVFLDYGSTVTANWFAYAQRSGNDPTADRVGMFEFWFSNTPFNDTIPDTPADSVVKIDPDDERLFDSTLRPYTLSGEKSGRYVAIRLTVSEVSASRPTNNIGGHEFRLMSGPSDLVLEVNRATGAMTLRNNGPNAQNIDLQAITIDSPSGALNADAYNGVGGDSGFPLGNGTGNGWEIGGGSNANRIVEAYFNGASTLTAGTAGIPLGNAYNPLTLAEDLTFRWTTHFIDDNELIVRMFDGVVNYVGTAPNITLGDYNNDGTVDARDYVVWRNNFGTSNVMPNDSTPGSVDIDDYERWKANFGNGGPGSLALAANQVPEPHSIVLSLLATVVGATAIRRRLS
jgi:hypothetical protein